MRLAQISDLHVRPEGQLAYGTVDTNRLVTVAVDRLNALGDQIDAVLATGDLVDEGRPDEYAYLRTQLDRLTRPYYLMVGNHDLRAPLREAFGDHTYLHDAGPFVQYAIDIGEVRVVALDSLVEGESGGHLCEARLTWLRDTLARSADRPVIIALHHPPFETGLAQMDEICLEHESAREFERLVRDHPNIERVLAGHVHRPMLRRFGGTLAVTCPSTAHQVALDLRKNEQMAFVMEPGGFAIHDWMPGRGMVTHFGVTGNFGDVHPF
ncbi:3',5'-cyclic adenosine monophosphate phosphodiesterase CpdA [Pararobbsia alpina]|uniref:phosphodiesterase n=1 Tax=Pararobbsia alpina TaxID=621374 RepID=UPI0039A77C27